ncbi:hypothetical protein L3Q82_017730 [Scortum barcoo]|uniref:Uncharacterized protein n=1 Tax=Scortum barcoo TaxID=214431 RepID=A0ACB8VLQ8_9TELE|nr:hypothetical protein L3Q82_017730 [Scortum barcoo]
MRSVYRTVVVKKELSRKAKLSIYRSIYVPTLTYGHELWSRCSFAHREESAEVAWASISDAPWAPRLPREVFQACPTGRRRPRGRPRTRWRDYVSRLAWERLGIPPEELEEVSGVREVWASLLRLLPPRPGPGPSG